MAVDFKAHDGVVRVRFWEILTALAGGPDRGAGLSAVFSEKDRLQIIDDGGKRNSNQAEVVRQGAAH
jgi:hypothetical protein